MAQEELKSWADESDDVMETEVNEDGIKYVTEIHIKSGKRVRVTKKVRVNHTKTSKRVEERKNWKHFGLAAEKDNLDVNVTSIGDPIYFEFEHGKSADAIEKEVKRAQLRNQIKADLAELHQAAVPEKSATTEESSKPAAQAPGKYVPPALQRIRAAESSGATGRYEDVGTTVRVSNLPEEAVEDDLQTLFRKVGVIHRTFIAKTHEGISKCFGFVRFSSPHEADKAVAQFNGLVWDNLVLSVEISER